MVRDLIFTHFEIIMNWKLVNFRLNISYCQNNFTVLNLQESRIRVGKR